MVPEIVVESTSEAKAPAAPTAFAAPKSGQRLEVQWDSQTYCDDEEQTKSRDIVGFYVNPNVFGEVYGADVYT
ncbi:hypothetical protein Hamer_G011748 [Homarus americanus]|uniref:Uncharacterized protein n=1 Tax=Homarus americanus TaxID=6706 RepID=A0A8J5K4E0_HOMAM|nr:hypothetical protein Hamer_G011748 [Homarus americanus]